MNGFLKKCFIGLLIIACLPLLPTLLAGLFAASPLLVLIALLFGMGSLKSIGRGVWKVIKSIITGMGGGLAGMFGGMFGGMFKSLSWLFGKSPRSNRLMGPAERGWRFRTSHGGFLIDGHHKRLSEKASYESLLIQGGMGRGKSTTFVMPNLLSLPKSQPSFVITDTSGEIYQSTSGYLARQGYDIKVLNLMDLSGSESYNPLANAGTPQDIAEIAQSLVKTSQNRQGRNASDPFWEQSAEKLIRILAQCLQNRPDPQYRNFANLRHLVTSFDAHTAPMRTGFIHVPTSPALKSSPL